LAVIDSHAAKVAESSAASFLRPDDPRFATGIYLIHPYDPNKTPILFIHGLLSSPFSWQNMINDLCSDPRILEHYQPWFFLYPTGQSVLESAAQLRQDLQATQKLFDPSGTAVPFRHVVVVAHSMGGLLAHTLVSDSENALWNAVANKPLDALSLQPAERSMIFQYFFFRHQPCIDRIIFMAVPHRGSCSDVVSKTIACSSRLAIWVPAMRMTPLAYLASAGLGSKPRARFQCKSTVYGLNGRRARFVIALSLVTYEHAI